MSATSTTTDSIGKSLKFLRSHHLIISLAAGAAVGVASSMFTRHYMGAGLGVTAATYYLTDDKQLGMDLMHMIGSEMDGKKPTDPRLMIAGKIALGGLLGWGVDYALK